MSMWRQSIKQERFQARRDRLSLALEFESSTLTDAGALMSMIGQFTIDELFEALDAYAHKTIRRIDDLGAPLPEGRRQEGESTS